MKRKALIAAVVIGMLSLSGAVVYENGTSPSSNVDDGEMAITSTGSLASATTSVGPNGTEYTVKVEMAGRNPNITEERLENISRNLSSISFTGYIQAPTPCHTLDHEVVEMENGGYVLNMTLHNPMEACVQQQTMIEYDAEFEAQERFDLKVMHEGDTIRDFDYEKPGKGIEPKKSILVRFLEWLGLA